MFTKLRISSHNLHIETGRHKRPKKTPVENRYCRPLLIVLVKILKMKCTLFVTVNYIKIYVPNFLKKSLILCAIFLISHLNKNLL